MIKTEVFTVPQFECDNCHTSGEVKNTTLPSGWTTVRRTVGFTRDSDGRDWFTTYQYEVRNYCDAEACQQAAKAFKATETSNKRLDW